MANAEIFLVAAAGLVAIGLHGLVARPGALRKLIAVNVMGAGVFLLLVTYAGDGPRGVPDAVPHALVLTGIVVAVSFTGFAVALIRRIEDEEEGDE